MRSFRSIVFVATAVALVGLAGCAAPQGTAPNESAGPTGGTGLRAGAPSNGSPNDAGAPGQVPDPSLVRGAVAFGPAVDTGLACERGCFEANVAVDGAGRIVVTSSEDAFARSTDGGATFTPMAPPPNPPGADDNTPRGDGLLQAGPDGRLYYSALIIDSREGLPTLPGIQVAVSGDGGVSWPVNTYVSLEDDPMEPAYEVDRQWLGFAADGTLYLAWSQVPSGLWTARSDDGGVSWTTFTRVVGTEVRGTVGMAGPPVVDAAGVVYMPFVRGAIAPGLPEPASVGIAVSHDRGASYALLTVRALPFGQRASAWFPVAAAGDGVVAVGWWETSEPVTALLGQETTASILVAASRDGGATWSQPFTVHEGKPVTAPWIALESGRLDVLYYEGQGNSASLVFARIGLNRVAEAQPPPVERVVLARGVSGQKLANTDFPHFVHHGGKAVAVWGDAGEGAAFVAVES